jgi:hypothetical protein
MRSPTFIEGTAAEVPLDNIPVADRLVSPHPIVAMAKEALQDAKDDADGMLKLPKGCMALCVSRQHLSRSLRLADALLKACEQRGWPVQMLAEHTVALVQDVEITIAIAEALDRVEAPPEPAKGHYTFQYNRPRYVGRPSGHLTISIDSRRHFWSSSARRNWNGSDKRPIEGCLSSVVRGMEKLAAAFRAHNEDQERQRRLEAERHRAAELARQEQEHRQRAIAEETARVDRLLEQARRWQTSQTLRDFIRAAQRCEATSRLGLHGEEFATWTAWATRQADNLDPLAPQPTSGDQAVPGSTSS